MFNDFSSSLSQKEMYIFEFISSNIFLVSKMSLKELSLKLNVTEYSINKFCKKINVDNFGNLISILKDFSKGSMDSSNYIFKNSIEMFSVFVERFDEIKIEEIANLILKYNSFCILHSDSSKIISQYAEQKFKNLNFKISTSSTPKNLSKNKNVNLIIYISVDSDELSIKNTLKFLSNKIVITISDKLFKEVHDNSHIFFYIDSNKIFKNFNLTSDCLYFVFLDLLISKIIEASNSKK